ncbi:hypothetical protein LTR08_007605 [Meristemomyces frigidus]|nr:hypothetical protein LTR08_007605 [Meristemomyces frigidus]
MAVQACIPHLFLDVFNSTLLICVAAVSCVCYHLFGNESIDNTIKTGEPPTREHFFAHHFRPVSGLIDAECIICREEPDAPIRVNPCNHIFCEEHINQWFARGNTRCPQCTIELFVESNDKLETLNKLIVATNFLNVLVTTVMLLSTEDLGRSRVVLSTLLTAAMIGQLIEYGDHRKRYGARWWRHREDLPGDGEDDEWQELCVAFELLLVFAWLWWTSDAIRVRL